MGRMKDLQMKFDEMKDRLPKDSFQCFVATVNAEQCLNEPSDPRPKVTFFTWNPNPNRKDFTDHLIYHCKWMSMLEILLKLRNCCSYYCIVPEISDHGRLHCHGWIVISDKLKWKKSMLGNLSRNGFLKLTKQKYWEKGFDYYVKELDDTSKILDPQLCVLSHFTNLPMRQEILERRILNNKKDIQYCKKKIEDYFSVYESQS